MNKAEEKTLKGIIIFLAIVSLVFSCVLVSVMRTSFDHFDLSFLLSFIVLILPIIISIFTLYFLKVKYNKIKEEKKKNVYAVLFLIINFLPCSVYIWVFLRLTQM